MSGIEHKEGLGRMTMRLDKLQYRHTLESWGANGIVGRMVF